MKMTYDLAKEFLDYDENTGKLTWKNRGVDWFSNSKTPDAHCKTWNTRYAGKDTGYIVTNKYGYPCIKFRFQGRLYTSSRVIWLWMTGEYPKGQIDHLNRDSTDNRWCNLRDVSPSENSRNMSMSCKNTSGVTGVYWNKEKLKWHAQCQYENRTYRIGTFDNIEDAAKAAYDFRKERGFVGEYGQLVNQEDSK